MSLPGKLLHLKLLFSVPDLLCFIALTQFLSLYPNTEGDNRNPQTHNGQLSFTLKQCVCYMEDVTWKGNVYRVYYINIHVLLFFYPVTATNPTREHKNRGINSYNIKFCHCFKQVLLCKHSSCLPSPQALAAKQLLNLAQRGWN